MSGDQYHITDQNAMYFVTFTVIDWVDVFTRKEYKVEIVNSLNYCIQEKGLVVHAWVIMSNHMHLVCHAKEGFRLSDIIRDFKKFTAKKIISFIESEHESRKVWLLKKFEFAGKRLRRISKYKFWKDDNHAILLEPDNSYMIDQKVDYIHNNPVSCMIVEKAHHYIFSSAKDYFTDEKGLVKVDLLH